MTIKIKTVCTNGNPLIKLFINGQNATEKAFKPSTFCFDANILFASKEIPRNSVIKIEVWNDDTSIIKRNTTLVQSEEGSITSFINEPIRIGAKIPQRSLNPFKHGFLQSSFEMAIFWENQYNE